MNKEALIISRILKFPQNNRTDFLAQPKINIQNFKSTPGSLKQHLKAFARKRSMRAPDRIEYLRVINKFVTGLFFDVLFLGLKILVSRLAK